MAEITKIQWADHTWNPWRGCQHALLPSGTENSACANCYAEAMSRMNPTLLGEWGSNGTRVVAAEQQWSLPEKWNKAAEKAGERRRVFVNSLSDFFEDWQGPMRHHSGGVLCRSTGGWCIVNDADQSKHLTMADVRVRAFAVIDECPWLDFLVLTKRPENIWKFWEPTGVRPLPDRPVGLSESPHPQRRDNVWLGTSAGDQASADALLPALLKCRDLSPVLFVSAEPLLGPVSVSRWMRPKPDCEFIADDGTCGHEENTTPECHAGVNCPIGSYRGIDWLIVGGESGPKSRPCDVAWIRSLIRQCKSCGIPCFMKQVGTNSLLENVKVELRDKKGGDPGEWQQGLRVREFPGDRESRSLK